MKRYTQWLDVLFHVFVFAWVAWTWGMAEPFRPDRSLAAQAAFACGMAAVLVVTIHRVRRDWPR
jgi:hypothetical protein